ncbi:glycosyl hydrolase 115 family protein [Mangrovimonas sp. TPBH4]|uniref:glycosyl hydrolase 115 family protein n=1 Tax=Mangrovimonas sp. TPBH4 TaxID=1645914 RepID=UPI0006B43E15|nr:glycosyl hydrolase 115 family protein [Mangrovimonas sp. TPBH4]
MKALGMNLLNIALGLLLLCKVQAIHASSGQSNDSIGYISVHPIEQGFAIFHDQKIAPIIVSAEEYPGVKRVATHLQNDLETVTSSKPKLQNSIPKKDKNIIIIGSLESPIIQELARTGKLDINPLKGRYEKHIITTVKAPFKGIDQALIIAGSDKRGTIYGIYDLSNEIGISPWYYWADVPVSQKETLFVKPGTFTKGEPKVKYRGIFINDEAPALRGWAKDKFGGFNAQFYDKVFELILRNKGNFLWPAMWQPSAFADDDPENARLADEYGVVISTSHHEPMMRAHDEWRRYGVGPWNFTTNKEQLLEFWNGGIRRMNDYESIVTLGMRGDGDEAMSEDTAVDLLKEIISEQRGILKEGTKKPLEDIPQVWALYKEVQDYYDKGMRVNDDIMILFCDDNWGNVRILPKKEDLDHKGGFGMYYHFDFVGGPVSYRWLNVTQIERVWEQMNLSYQWGVKDLWLVNVGDIKPMELPISFFLDFAWNAEGIKSTDLPAYYTNWATQQFGPTHANDIAEILSLYTKYNARRTPEMLKPDTYSIENYREAERIIQEYDSLVEKSKRIYQQLDENYRPAFYQLVLSPVELCSNLNKMYVAIGKNRLYSQQGRASANNYAEKAKEHFLKDSLLTEQYHQLNNGKWKHIMSQTHIGYTNWNNPPVNKMPDISVFNAHENGKLGYVIEHGKPSDPEKDQTDKSGVYSQSFSSFDPINDQTYYIEIFNKGQETIDYGLHAKEEWIKLSSKGGTLQYDDKIFVSIDWDLAPKVKHLGEILMSSNGKDISLQVPIWNTTQTAKGFVENNGVIAIEASHYSNKHDSKEVQWIEVPNMGRTHSAITVMPSNSDTQEPGLNTPYLEYEFTIFKDSEIVVETYLSPTLNFKKNEGLQFAIAIDQEAPQIINMHEGEDVPDWEYPEWWNKSVADHIKKKLSKHDNISAGTHKLKVWMIDPGVVFQKFVIDLGGLRPSYLGPPESNYVKK